MLKNPKVGDLIENTSTWQVAKVIAVEQYLGWVRLQYFDTDAIREYAITTPSSSSIFRHLSPEEKADFILRRETLGITDHWQE